MRSSDNMLFYSLMHRWISTRYAAQMRVCALLLWWGHSSHFIPQKPLSLWKQTPGETGNRLNVFTVQTCQNSPGLQNTNRLSHNKHTDPRTYTHARWSGLRTTSCPQLLRRPSRCVRARPPKVNGRMTLWWSEEGKVLHFTALEFYFICWHVWPASFLGGCCMSLGLSGLFIMPSKRREPLPLCRSRYTSRPVSF